MCWSWQTGMAAQDSKVWEPVGLQPARQCSAVEPQWPSLEQQGESDPHLFDAEHLAQALDAVDRRRSIAEAKEKLKSLVILIR